MYWNYRIVRRDKGFCSIYEVYYNKKTEKIMAWAPDITPYGANPKELKADLKKMREAFDLPVIDLKDLPGSGVNG